MSGGGTVQVRAVAEGVFPMHSLELVHNGRVVATADDPVGTRRLTLDIPLTVEEDGWVAARVGGPGYFGGPGHNDIWQRGVFAHTSPIYLATGRDWDRYDPRVAGYVTTLLRGALSYVRHTAAHASAGKTSFHHGEDDHLAYLERPFREALDALSRRDARAS